MAVSLSVFYNLRAIKSRGKLRLGNPYFENREKTEAFREKIRKDLALFREYYKNRNRKHFCVSPPKGGI